MSNIRHSWNLTPSKAAALQERLAGRVRIEPLPGQVKTVAGTDCSFAQEGKKIIAAAVLCDADTMETLHIAHVIRDCGFPYVPGLLSFREAPAVIAAVKKLPVRPDLLICDGQGLAHPRGLGLASHVGLWLDLPTIGVAKSRLCGRHAQPGLRRGCRRRLVLGDQTIGTCLRTRMGVKPLYVSVGHRITLSECIRWTLRAGRGLRLPEPTRLADHVVGRLRRVYARDYIKPLRVWQ